jgi:hypothetical protein
MPPMTTRTVEHDDDGDEEEGPMLYKKFLQRVPASKPIVLVLVLPSTACNERILDKED